MLVETNFEEMTDAELRMCVLRFVALFNQTGRDEYSRLADRADELRMQRMLAAPNPYATEGDKSMPAIPLKLLIQKHRQLKLAGVPSLAVRNRIITLAWLRKHDFTAWVKARAQMDVFDVIEADGEQMIERLTKGQGGFRRDEITLVQPQVNERRAV